MALNLAGGVTAYELMIDNFSKTLSYTPVTKTISNITGDETLTDGTADNISGAFFRKLDKYSQEIQGLMDNADAVLMVKNSVTIVKNDKITYDGQTYRINDVITRRLGTYVFYKYSQCFLI